MLSCLIFVGRTSGSWFQMHSLILLWSPRDFRRLWHHYCTLEQQCYSFLTQGLALSTRHSYDSAQAKFIFPFAVSWGSYILQGPPAQQINGHCLFITFLARTIQHSSIKVYLSGVRALHIEQRFPDPLLNCLRLQQVVRSTKHCHGSSSSNWLPITNDLMLVIWYSLDLHLLDHCMFEAPCSLGYFGFLHASEFTIPNLSSILSFTSFGYPSCIRITIKGSRTYPFRKGSFIHIGVKRHPLGAILFILRSGVMVQAPRLCFKMESLS